MAGHSHWAGIKHKKGKQDKPAQVLLQDVEPVADVIPEFEFITFTDDPVNFCLLVSVHCLEFLVKKRRG